MLSSLNSSAKKLLHAPLLERGANGSRCYQFRPLRETCPCLTGRGQVIMLPRSIQNAGVGDNLPNASVRQRPKWEILDLNQ